MTWNPVAENSTIYEAFLIIDGRTAQMDVIEYEGMLWLVPEWLDLQDGLTTTPARIVSLATMEHTFDPGLPPPHVVVSRSQPIRLFDLSVPPEEAGEVQVRDHPGIMFRKPPTVH